MEANEEGNKAAQGVKLCKDPVLRIGSLPSAVTKLITVSPSDTLSKVITLLLQHDFSQLPIMAKQHEVIGVVTWKSIATKSALKLKLERADDCLEDAQIVNSDEPLFEAMESIIRSGYVLVRQRSDQRITGLVTASDLSLQFQTLAEPFLLLQQIELHVREILGQHLSESDLKQVESPLRPAKTVAKLSLGQLVQLLQQPPIWAKLDIRLDKGVLTKALQETTEIRNKVMHFAPDPITHAELTLLENADRLLITALSK